MNAPYSATFVNPLSIRAQFGKKSPPSHFIGYQIQTVRMFAKEDFTGQHIADVTTEAACDPDCLNAVSPVMFAIYGLLNDGTKEHLFDRISLGEAHATLSKMGVAIQSKDGA